MSVLYSTSLCSEVLLSSSRTKHVLACMCPVRFNFTAFLARLPYLGVENVHL
jgi:hypothetical protein